MNRVLVALGFALCAIACDGDRTAPPTPSSGTEAQSTAIPSPPLTLTAREYAQLVCVAADHMENFTREEAMAFYDRHISMLRSLQVPKELADDHNSAIRFYELLLAMAQLTGATRTPEQFEELSKVRRSLQDTYDYYYAQQNAPSPESWLVWHWPYCQDELTAEIGKEYPFRLGIHCGLWYARFDGRDWEAHPSPELEGPNAPPGWEFDSMMGTMVLVEHDRARFTNDANGESVYFSPWPPDKEIWYCI